MATHTEKQPEPVLTRAGIVTAITILSALLVKVGAGNVSTWLDENSTWIAGLLLAAGPLVTGALARLHVTPNSRPKANDSTPLVPVGTLAASNAAVDLALAQVKAIEQGASDAPAVAPDPVPATP